MLRAQSCQIDSHTAPKCYIKKKKIQKCCLELVAQVHASANRSSRMIQVSIVEDFKSCRAWKTGGNRCVTAPFQSITHSNRLRAGD